MSDERVFKSGCYNGSMCYGGIIYCIQGDIKQSSMDKILDLIDEYCDIQEALIDVNIKEANNYQGDIEKL